MKKIWGAIASYVHTTDTWLVLLWLAASGASMLFLYGTYNSGLTYSNKLVSQLMAIGIGFVAAIIISLIDYHTLLKLWKLYVPVCVVLVALTLTSLGVLTGGNQAWLEIKAGGRTFSMQPSELMKIAFITTFALHLDKVKEKINAPLHVLLLLAHAGGYIGLVTLQGDGGTAIIFVCIFAVMIFCAGIGWRYILGFTASLVVVLPVLWLYVMTESQKLRILVVFNPERDLDKAFQQTRSAIALGIGGVQGTGIFSGRHVPVPEIYNDFIFSFIGEASGFMGCIGVILLLTAICLKILFNTHRSKDDLGRWLCIGVFAMMVSQMLINLGMCIGLLPVIGVTLPLLSAGGTSVLSLYVGLGLVLSVYTHNTVGMFEK